MYRLTSKLIIYRGIGEESILHCLAEICRRFDEGSYDREELTGEIYEQVHRLLDLATRYGFNRNLWHNYLAFLIATTETPFTLVSEKVGANEGSVNAFALNDFKIFRELFCYDFSRIESALGINCFTILENYTAVGKPERVFNRSVSEKVQELSARIEEACRPQVGPAVDAAADAAVVARVLLQAGGEGGTQIRRQQGEKPVGRNILQPVVGASEFIVVILDRGGQVAGHDLGGIVINGQGQDMLRIGIPAIAVAPDDGDRVGDHSNLERMLGVVLRLGVAHKTPAADQLQPGKISKKSVGHSVSFREPLYPGGREVSRQFQHKKASGRNRPDAEKRKRALQLAQLLQAVRANHFVLIGREITASAAEETVRLVFAENDGTALHEDFDHVLGTDSDRSPKLYRQNNPAKCIKLTDDTRCFHGKNLLRSRRKR